MIGEAGASGARREDGVVAPPRPTTNAGPGGPGRRGVVKKPGRRNHYNSQAVETAAASAQRPSHITSQQKESAAQIVCSQVVDSLHPGV